MRRQCATTSSGNDRAVDGWSRQVHKAAVLAEAIAHYLEGGAGPVNLTSLHEWLVAEHD